MEKVLVDTSVWIDYFSGRASDSHKKRLQNLTDLELVVISDIILNELLVGAPNESGFTKLNRMFSDITALRISDEHLHDFNLFCFEMRKKGLPGKYTDLSIAFLAQLHDIPLWSLDQYFSKLSTKKIIKLFTAS